MKSKTVTALPKGGGVITWVVVWVTAAMGLGVHADSVKFDTTGSASDSATVEFIAVAGGIKIEVTNTSPLATLAYGDCVSNLSFKVSGIAVPTRFTELTGRRLTSTAGGWTPSSGTALDDTSSAPPDVIDHWAFGTSGSTVGLATAGGYAAAKPTDMILSSSGMPGSGGSLGNAHGDFIIGPADFFLTVAGVTANTSIKNDISYLKVGFGTSPDITLGTTIEVGSPPPLTPLPSGILAGAALLGCVGVLQAVRHKHAAIG